MAILVMLNNYFHDLATAVFAVSAIAAWLLLRFVGDGADRANLQPVVRGLVKLGFGALVWVLVAGAFRAWAYRDYEWVEAVGKDQVTVLVVKHILLVTVVAVGIVFLIKVQRRVRRLGKAES